MNISHQITYFIIDTMCQLPAFATYDVFTVDGKTDPLWLKFAFVIKYICIIVLLSSAEDKLSWKCDSSQSTSGPELAIDGSITSGFFRAIGEAHHWIQVEMPSTITV